MIDPTKKYDCNGCSACADICSVNAISMKEDGMGFMHPTIDRARCVNCGMCEKVCRIGRPLDLKSPVSVSAMRLRDKENMAASQSGGAFVALSGKVLAEGGTVYGAQFAEDLRVTHSRAVTPGQRDAFRGSKYVQSDMRGIYHRIVADLRNDMTVLFSGTPCQVSAVKDYVESAGCRNGKLITVDIICHGVASPRIYRDYLKSLEKMHGCKIEEVRFRDKDFGWHSHRETFAFSDGTRLSPPVMVYKDRFLRKSCNRCGFCSPERVSDITIGDFWGIEKIDRRFAADVQGCSIVMCNTPEGKALFESISPVTEILDIKDGTDYLQMNLSRPTPDKRDPLFPTVYEILGFRMATRLYGYVGVTEKIRRKLGRLKNRLLSECQKKGGESK